METALIVGSSEKGNSLLIELLKTHSIQPIEQVSNGKEARILLKEKIYDIVIISTPLRDEFGHELAMQIAQKTSQGIILLVKQELVEAVSKRVEEYGIFIVEKPLAKVLFFQALKFARVSSNRIMALQKENTKLHNKIIAIKTIDRAKYALIQYLKMSEEQAHKYIEKQAMDRQLTREKVAESILKMYES